MSFFNSTSSKSSEDQIKHLLAEKRKHLEDVKSINDKLEKLGLTPTKSTKGGTKKAPAKAKSSDATPPIKATVQSMKAFLSLEGIKIPSNATRKDLEIIIRDKHLIKKCEDYHYHKAVTKK